MRLGRHSTASMLSPAMVAASGCAPPMPPRPAVRIHLPASCPPKCAPAHLGEGLVSALHDALAADVDPGAGRHLAVHRQALAIELVEVLPGGPVRHEIGIGDEHARRIGVRREHADRLAGLHQQGLLLGQSLQRLDDAVVAIPVARGAADAAVDDQLARDSPRLPGSRLFISMRSGASVVQVRALKCVPRAARMIRGLEGGEHGLTPQGRKRPDIS